MACFAEAAAAAAALAARLGWAPDIFWAATPADLRLALGLGITAPVADRDLLTRLMEADPDG